MPDILSSHFNPGAVARPLDLRDIKLGSVQAPVDIPAKYETDIGWLAPIWQAHWPACGAHAGTHLKMVLDHFDPSASHEPCSPNYLWKQIKLIDNFPPEVGTDMRSILDRLSKKGVCDYSLLPNDYDQSLVEYTDPTTLTPKLDENAQPRIIKSYGFGNQARLKQDIYLNKAVIILIDIGNTWWGQKNIVPFTRKDGGHFVVAYGYDTNGILIIDSADKTVPLKRLSLDYVIRETGTAIDLPDEQVRALTAKLATLQKIVALMQKVLSLKKLLHT